MERNEERVGGLTEVLTGEQPLQRPEKNIYIAAVREHFTEIRMLRKDGFSFVQICRALVKTEKLPENMKVRCFRQAFRRECLKQEREGVLTALLGGASKPVVKKIAGKPENQKPLQRVEAQGNEAEVLERERRKKLGTKTIPLLGGGSITKTLDGGFEFD